MTQHFSTPAIAKEETMPLVLIVRSTHLRIEEDLTSSKALLERLLPVVYMRNYVLAMAAAIYNPTYLYADGWFDDSCKYIDSVMGQYSGAFQKLRDEKGDDWLPHMPSLWSLEQALPHLKDYVFIGNDLKTMAQEIKSLVGEDAWKDVHGNYDIERELGMIPNHGVELVRFEDDMLGCMLAVQAYSTGLDVVFRPFESDNDLYFQSHEANQLMENPLTRPIVEGRFKTLNGMRETRLKNRILDDLSEGPRNAVVYCGSVHRMAFFSSLPQTAGIDAAFIDVKGENGTIVIEGTLPYIPDVHDPDTLLDIVKQSLTQVLDVNVNLDIRPVQSLYK